MNEAFLNWVSDHVVPTKGKHNSTYCPAAFVPSRPRIMSPEERSSVANRICELGVSVHRFEPESLLDIQKDTTGNFLLDFIKHLFISGLCEEVSHINGFIRNDGDMFTTTVDRNFGTKTGLHIDSWDRAQIRDRKFAENRLSVNLGPGDRYLLVCEANIDDICCILADQKVHTANASANWLVREFLDAVRPRVAWLRIPAFSAYIAPTEWIIHDGSTFMQEQGCTHLTIRGSFVGRLQR